MNIFEKREQRERLEKEIQQAKKSVSQQKRTDRELKKVQSGGRVSSFLKRQAENNSVLSATINVATAPDPLKLGQAIIQYQEAINESKKDFLQRDPIERPDTPDDLPVGENVGDLLYWDGAAWVILTPPLGSDLRVLATNGGVPFWAETEDC